MYIADKKYTTDFSSYNIRCLLINTLYKDPIYINHLMRIICSRIECLSIDYDPVRFTITVKIKKTAMKKIHGFKQDSTYYYNIMINVFLEFMNEYKDILINAMNVQGTNGYKVMSDINTYLDLTLANICHVTCIADNIVSIKL